MPNIINEDHLLIINILKKILKILIKIDKQTKQFRVKNKGTGAGGTNTNVNGINYESITYLPKLLKIEDTKIYFGKGSTDYYHKYNN